MHVELSNPAPFILLPQIPVILFGLWMLWNTRDRGILITMPTEAPPVGQRIKVDVIGGGQAPFGLVAGQMYVVVWSKGCAFRVKKEGK